MTPSRALIPRRLLKEQIDYAEREAVKAAARDRLTDPEATFEERKRGALLVICMWWQRNSSLCPDFDVYVQHLLAADRAYEPGGTLHENRFGADVLAWLIESYGLAKPCFINPGFSDFQKRIRPRAGGRR